MGREKRGERERREREKREREERGETSARRRRAHLLESDGKGKKEKKKGERGEGRGENVRAVGARRVPYAVQARARWDSATAPLHPSLTLAPLFECFGNVTGDR